MGNDVPHVGLVCADSLRCLGLEMLLRETPEVHFVRFGEVGEIDLSDLDIVILDRTCCEDMPRLLRTIRQRRSSLKVIVFGPQASMEIVQTMIGAGAKGYLSYDASLEEVQLALRIVADGSLWAPRKVLARLLESAQAKHQADADLLQRDVFITPRENEVLQLVSQGQTNQDIAVILSLDVGTVKSHISKLMRKAGVGNRTALAMQALSQRMLVRDPRQDNG